jgi:preprotein translocase subunit SecA
LPFEPVSENGAPQTVAGALGTGTNGNGAHAPEPQKQERPVNIPVYAPTTTIDAIERDFMKKKERELQTARSAGASDTTANGASTQRRTADKVGPNALCPCGSGKKYKKCHGA